MTTIESLYVPDLAPALKHPTVLKKFDDLEIGESFLLINDHDPIPLYYEMKAEKGDVFDWNKIENGPELWKVEITKTATSSAGNPKLEHADTNDSEDLYVINVPMLEPRQKHPTIFRHFDSIKSGEAFIINNDHDPKPLYYQMIAERGNIFTWEYLEKGPVWRVKIQKNDGNAETLGEIAVKDLRKAEVFKKYGLDFCCGGKKTVQQACAEKGLDVTKVEEELRLADKNPMARPLPYNDWSIDFLADYIVNTHHSYVKNTLPDLRTYAAKLAQVHGSRHPELLPIQEAVEEINKEMSEHMVKEEVVLFPFIKELVSAKSSGRSLQPANFGSVENPIHMMEHEHETVGGLLEQVRTMSNNYQLPDDACATYGLFYKMMEEFESDLHIHVHLENNILFPKALKMEKEIR